nr:DUF3427 domain-containing protein [Mesorhizobium sp. WSM3882]
MAHGEECPFCSLDPKRVAFEDQLLMAIWDRFPVSDGHMLIVPKRHAAGWDDLDQSEKGALISGVDKAIDLIRNRYGSYDFNVGFNHGAAAGQTVFHFHLHVIPRRPGDVPDPRGGVRHVIPAKGNYLAERPLSTLSGEVQQLVTGGEDPLLPHLILHLDRADKCEIAVSFLLDSGARLIAHHLADFLERGGRAEILVGDYLDVTDPVALRRLSDLEGDLTLRIYQTAIGRGFHLKSYSFLTGSQGVAFVGSSNLSEPALTDSIEWNYKVVSSHDTSGFSQVRTAFASLFSSRPVTAVSQDWIDAYERRRTIAKLDGPLIAEPDIEFEEPFPIPSPHEIQQEALQALERTREDGYSAGLVVLATGLGKTWLAAFDSNRSQFARVLFIAHRDEILTQAIETFRRIRQKARIGRMAGEVRETDADLVFASIQTLGRTNHLSRFQPTDFDYVVVDEFHHAAAGTYRRVIEYFEPKFLLGLTATPERADGADLLALCQENEVFNANIQDGIKSGRLCPFRYFGVPDDIDYSNIPWRSVRFDPEALDAAVATEARARNALEQLQSKGGRRCIGFCCSQRHADFMAAFFVAAGLRAVAVHAGPSSAPRTTSLKQLAEGEIEVIFAVDIFNEGVDVPAIDTVLMLRPTESTVIWMQQLGRGLRVAEDKQYLTVIDYIGNHRSFLTKLRAMAALIGHSAESKGHLREVLEEIRRETISLPPGCEVTYDLSTVDILQQLLRPSGIETALESFYRDFEERHGLRPNAVETFHAGINPRSNSEGSWLGFVDRMGGLSPEEQSAFGAARDFFVAMEKTEVTRSYKIVLLQALFDGAQLDREVAVDELARRVAAQVRRVHRLEEDFSVNLDDPSAVERLLVQNPIEAFVNARGTGGVPFFHVEDGKFALTPSLPSEPSFGILLREVLDWRLAQYLSRGGKSADVTCRVARNASGKPILFLPSGQHPLPADGNLEIRVDDRLLEAAVAKIAINVMRDPISGANELPKILADWFGADVGSPGRSDKVRLRFQNDSWLMEPMAASARSGDGLRLWERYLREAIGPAFGIAFDQATWNAGFVSKPPHLFLLVTLTKDDMSDEHQYADHFVSEREFSWQSQNRTKRDSKHGRMIRDHRAIGLHIHLLVRPTKKTGPKPTPFTYCGEVDFSDWVGEGPITVRWHLRDPVPPSLWNSLKVPA